MSEKSDSKTEMPEIKFGVDTSTGTPSIVVESVKGTALKKPVAHARMDEIINTIGSHVASMLDEALLGASQLRGLIDEYEESERTLAAFIVEHSAWSFAKQEGIPVFLFHPEHIPNELIVRPDSDSASEGYQKASGKSGWTKVKRGGKITLVRNRHLNDD